MALRIRPRSLVGNDAAWKQEAESRFEELTRLSVSIQNDIDSLMTPLTLARQAAAANTANTAAAGSTTAKPPAPAPPPPALPSYAASQKVLEAIRKRLASLNERLIAVESSASDQDSAVDREWLADAFKTHSAITDDLQSSFRRALLTLQQHWSSPENVVRGELFGGAPGPSSPSGGSDESAASKSARVTDAMQHARRMISAEVDRATNALGALQNSTATMERVRTEYDVHGQAIGTGRHLITMKLRRERTDRMLLLAGVFCFLSVVLYIWWRRLGSRFATLLSSPLSVFYSATTGAGAGAPLSSAVGGDIPGILGSGIHTDL